MASKLIEVAFVVEDLSVAIAHWTRTFRVGPFFAGVFEVPDQRYRGRPAPGRTKVAFSFTNGALIELIEPLSGPNCVFAEALARSGPGFHHMLFETSDHDAEVAHYQALGFHVVQSGTFAGSQFSIVDTRDSNGGYIEIMPFGEGLQNLYAQMRAANESWDGYSDPERAL